MWFKSGFSNKTILKLRLNKTKEDLIKVLQEKK
jgi:hypothetical protein